MAIGRPKTIGDAPEGPERSGGCCWRDFLASRGMGVSAGEESRANSVAAQTIEAQPVFGQIEPSQRPRASRAEHLPGRRWWASFLLRKMSKQFGVEKETKEGKKAITFPRNQSRTNDSNCGSTCAGRYRCRLIEALRGRWSRLAFARARIRVRVRVRARCSNRPISQDQHAMSLLMRCGCKYRLSTDPGCPVRIARAGLGEYGQPCPCCAADEDRASASKDVLPSRRRHSELRHRKCDMVAGECGRQSEQFRYKSAQYQKLRHSEGELRKCQRYAAGGDSDDWRTKRTRAAMVSPKPAWIATKNGRT
jgi:hypothetical protein